MSERPMLARAKQEPTEDSTNEAPPPSHLNSKDRGAPIHIPEARYLVKLGDEQARTPQVKFPPGCPVLYTDTSQEPLVVSKGAVAEVFIDISPNSSRDFFYKLSRGRLDRPIVAAKQQLQWASPCGVWVELPQSTYGCEWKRAVVRGSYQENAGASPKYSVELLEPAAGVVHGIPHDSIQYRERGLTPPVVSGEPQLAAAMTAETDEENSRSLTPPSIVKAVSTSLSSPDRTSLPSAMTTTDTATNEEIPSIVDISTVSEEGSTLAPLQVQEQSLIPLESIKMTNAVGENEPFARPSSPKDLEYEYVDSKDESKPQRTLTGWEKNATERVGLDESVDQAGPPPKKTKLLESACVTESDAAGGTRIRTLASDATDGDSVEEKGTLVVKIPKFADHSAVRRRLVGKQGLNHKDLARQTRCQIRIYGLVSKKRDSQPVEVEIVGRRSDLGRAQRIVENEILGTVCDEEKPRMLYFLAKDNDYGSSTSFARLQRSPINLVHRVWMAVVELPTDFYKYRGLFVHRGGKGISQLVEDTRCRYISVMDAQPTYMYLEDSDVCAVNRAVDAVERRVNWARNTHYGNKAQQSRRKTRT